MQSQSFEFSESQNQLFSDLARKMRFVSYFLIVLGVVSLIAGIFTLNRTGLGDVVQGVLSIVIGAWTGKASASFQLIVETRGNDIENLMGALGELRKLYLLQYWAILIALVFVVLALVLGVVAGVVGGT